MRGSGRDENNFRKIAVLPTRIFTYTYACGRNCKRKEITSKLGCYYMYPAGLVSASYTYCEHKRKVKIKMLRYIVFYLNFEVKFGLKVCGQI